MSYDICGKTYSGFLMVVSCILPKVHTGRCESENPMLDGTKFIRDEPLKKWIPKPYYKRRKAAQWKEEEKRNVG